MAEYVIELSSDSSAPPSPNVADSVQSAGSPTELISEPAVPVHNDFLSISDVEEALGISQSQKQVHCISDSDESAVAVEYEELTVCDDGDDQSCKDSSVRKRPRVQSLSMTGRRQRREEEKRRKEEERRLRQLERARKKAELQLDKAVKAAAAEQARAMKPGECLKYIHVQLDSALLTEDCGGDVLLALRGAEFRYSIQSMVVPRMVSWTRHIPQRKLGDGLELGVEEDVFQEDEVLLVRLWDEVVQLVHSGELCTHMQALKTILPGKKLTLIVYSMDQYFRYQKTRRNREFRGRVLGTDAASRKGGTNKALETAPVITHQQLDEALAEVQLFANCCHRLVESPPALAALVTQFTKAVAERPYKLEKQRKEQEKFDWFAVADSKDCVRVDRNGNGLLRLWKQQLCQFNLATLETAEAIASKYQSPQALIQAYSLCTSQRSAELLLQDIPIRRALGPLTSMRRVGPELSKKVHRFFTTNNGEAPLSQE